MYANKPNILELVALMLKFEINHIVLCPGSRNAPLSQSFASDKRFTCYAITDERSAAFFALGLTQSLKKPVAVCCTSGSALLNILPAVSEAYYQQLPLLVISADRPAEWIGQMDGQTLNQPNIANSIFKKSVQLPEVKDDSELWHCNRLINDALLTLEDRVAGSVHINIPLSEPLFDFSVSQLPDARKIERCRLYSEQFALPQSLLDEWSEAKNPMLIVGQLPYSEDISSLIGKLVKEKNCVVLSEHTSNIKSKERGVISNFDSVLYANQDDDALKPDLVIYLGGHIVSKRLKAFIRTNQPKYLWMIRPDGELVDTFKCLTTVVEADSIAVLEVLGRTEKVFEKTFQNYWSSLSDKTEEKAEKHRFEGFTDLSALKKVMEHLPECSLHLANSSVVRNAQLFYSENVKELFCNRGISGIEGSMSTAVGFSAQNDDLTYLFIGDLSFFYDMNALWNKYISSKLRIFVVNNGNGQIFNNLPILEKNEAQREFIAASHNASVKAWAEDRGFIYLSAEDDAQLDNALPLFCNIKVDAPLIFEVFTDSELSERDFKAYYKQLKID